MSDGRNSCNYSNDAAPTCWSVSGVAFADPSRPVVYIVDDVTVRRLSCGLAAVARSSACAPNTSVSTRPSLIVLNPDKLYRFVAASIDPSAQMP